MWPFSKRVAQQLSHWTMLFSSKRERQTDRQTDRKTERERDRKTDREGERIKGNKVKKIKNKVARV